MARSRSGAVKSETDATVVIHRAFILMPIAYQRDDHRRLITVMVTGSCCADDISGVIDRQADEHTWDYALFYDLRAMTAESIEADLQQIAERVKVVGGGRERGPVGIAIRARPALFLQGLLYATLTKELVDIEVLLTPAQIDSWLVRNAARSRQP
jgi:hypothetical protein